MLPTSPRCDARTSPSPSACSGRRALSPEPDSPKTTALNKATISSLVTELSERGLVAEGELERGEVGRPAQTVPLSGAGRLRDRRRDWQRALSRSWRSTWNEALSLQSARQRFRRDAVDAAARALAEFVRAGVCDTSDSALLPDCASASRCRLTPESDACVGFHGHPLG